MSQKTSKQYQQLSKQISQLLKDFQRTKEWADIGNWLGRLQPVLNSRKHPNLPHKIQLAKRLAQCLNPNLPAGIHSNTLNIYSIILNNFSCHNQLLPLFSIGLFPFFQYSSSSLKLQLLKIFQTHYVNTTTKTSQLLQMLTSLMNALLAGLNDNNQQLAKRIFNLCDKINSHYGRMWVDGAVWVNILKSSKVRVAGFKYFMKSFKDRDKLKNRGIDKEREEGEQTQQQQTQLQSSQQLINQSNSLSQSRSLKQMPSLKQQQTQSEPKQKQQSITYNINQQPQIQQISHNIASVYDSFVSDGTSSQTPNQLQVSLSKVKTYQDTQKYRFPNFSILVVGALSQCLQNSQSDTMVKRSALDLMIFYLRLDNKQLISKKDGIHLVTVMLQTIKSKQYSLNRRIYTYLFGQPNNQGVYAIDQQKREYQLELLREALERMIGVETNASVTVEKKGNSVREKVQHRQHRQKQKQKMKQKQRQKERQRQSNPEGILTILQILLKDHEPLRYLLLPSLSYKLLHLLKVSRISPKRVTQFYNNMITNTNPTNNSLSILQTTKQTISIFLTALTQQILSQQSTSSFQYAHEVVSTIQYFYTLRYQIQNHNKMDIPHEELSQIIKVLLRYLEKVHCGNQRIGIQVLELCNKFIGFSQNNIENAQNSSIQNRNQILKQQSISLLNQLIHLRPVNSIYAGLLTLHPHPPKQTLLPHITQTSLSIVCITNLLPLSLSEQQLKSVFFSIFKLLNCHLWEDQAIHFIKVYKNKYEQMYNQLIDLVEPSEWLIYWKKMNGDVDGGVIRMLKNLDKQNHLNKQLSKKWLEGSRAISSRVIDPVYKLMKVLPVSGMKQVYRMMQHVFVIQKADFITFFFLEKQRYFLPLIQRIFQCIINGDEDMKAQSIAMLVFLMEKANSIQQKILYIETTLNRTVLLLRKTLGGKGNYQRQIQIVQYFISMVDVFHFFKGKDTKIQKLQKLIQDSELYESVAMGLRETSVPYVRTLYIDFIQKSVQAFADLIPNSKQNKQQAKFLSEVINDILEPLFIMLRETDVNSLEQIIKGKQSSSQVANKRKRSQMSISIDPTTVSQTQFNVQSKYAQIIQLWNAVKFLVNVSIKNKLTDLPIQKLLSLILQSFPFSQIKYDQISKQIMQVNYEQLQQQIKNMTGLKKQVLQIFQTLWQNYKDKIINYLIQKGDPRVLIHGSVDPSAVVKAISKSAQCTKIIKYFKNQKFVLPKGSMHYNTEILLTQNLISYFLYLYLLYCNLKNMRKNNNFIESVLHLMKGLKISTHIQTKIWLMQILYCLYERVPFRQLHLQNPKIKTQFQQLAKDIIQQLVYVISKSRNFTHRTQIKTGIFNNIFGKQQGKQSSLFDFVKIFPPTIHKMSQGHIQQIKTKKNQYIVPVQDFVNYFLFNKWVNLHEDIYIQYLSAVCTKTFSSILIPLLINVYESEIQKIASLIRDWLLILFPLYQNKQQQNQLYLETVAQFLHSLLKNQPLKTQIIKTTRKNIIQIYMGNDFFKCTKNTLNNWKFIIDCCTQGNDLLGQLLLREGLFQGIFTRKAQSTRLKIKNFERVCFLIYSGQVNKYQNKLRVVLQNLTEVMKSQNPSPALLILILFCIRILLMRLSEAALGKMFKSFWPSLITLLIQIFTKQNFAECTNLLLAGLKVVELIHALQLQQFNIHKWIFIFDYFGLRIDTQSETDQLLSSHSHSKKILTPFKFKPILSRVLPQQPLKCTFLPQNWQDQSAETSKRKLIVKQSSIQNGEQLRNHALILLQYMMDLNQRRVVVVREEIEDLIQADFISLDDYIFSVK